MPHPQPSLRRELTLTNGTAIVVANMIGAGIFGTTGFLAGDLGKPSLVLGIWLAGALVALAGCLCYAELAINLPRPEENTFTCGRLGGRPGDF